MRSTITISFVTILLACDADEGTDSVGSGTTATDAGSEHGSGTEHVEHTGDHGHDETGGSTGIPEPGTGTGRGDDTGPVETTDAATGTTGAVAMDTWENWALPEFFDVYCNQCHPGESTRDFTVYEMVVANEEHIRCGVAPEAIPSCDPGHIEPGHLPIGPGPYPTDEERWRLVDWALAGMPRD